VTARTEEFHMTARSTTNHGGGAKGAHVESTRPNSEFPGEDEDPAVAGNPSSGTVDDNDDHDDEHPSENEASIDETSDQTEAPEEFEVANISHRVTYVLPAKGKS
jgi:hypothetical protein